MKLLLVLLLATNVAFADVLPNAELTSGVARDVTRETLCTTSTNLVRNVPQAEKNQVYAKYGLAGNDRSTCKQGYEIDHDISLELGGSNDIKNLWPQSYCGENNAHDKDKLENRLHKLICNGTMTIEAAQSCITTNWIQCKAEVMK